MHMALPNTTKQEIAAAEAAYRLETLPPVALQDKLLAAAMHVKDRVLPPLIKGYFGRSRLNRENNTDVFPVRFTDTEILLSSIHSTWMDLHRVDGYVSTADDLTIESFL